LGEIIYCKGHLASLPTQNGSSGESSNKIMPGVQALLV
jgi:hypothetical protein